MLVFLSKNLELAKKRRAMQWRRKKTCSSCWLNGCTAISTVCFALLLFLQSTFWKDVWNVSGDTSCCTMSINCTLLCCCMLYCTCVYVLLWHFDIFKYFNKEVHVSSSSTWDLRKTFLPWYRNWHRESCYFTGIGTDYWIFGIVTPLHCRKVYCIQNSFWFDILLK